MVSAKTAYNNIKIIAIILMIMAKYVRIKSLMNNLQSLHENLLNRHESSDQKTCVNNLNLFIKLFIRSYLAINMYIISLKNVR